MIKDTLIMLHKGIRIRSGINLSSLTLRTRKTHICGYGRSERRIYAHFDMYLFNMKIMGKGLFFLAK